MAWATQALCHLGMFVNIKDAEAVPRLLELLESSDVEVLHPMIESIYIVSQSSDHEVDAMIKSLVLPLLRQLLDVTDDQLFEYVLLVLNTIGLKPSKVSGNMNESYPLWVILLNSQDTFVLEKILLFVRNILSRRNAKDQIAALVIPKAMPIFMKLTMTSDPEVLEFGKKLVAMFSQVLVCHYYIGILMSSLI